jgi:hypothetical protein
VTVDEEKKVDDFGEDDETTTGEDEVGDEIVTIVEEVGTTVDEDKVAGDLIEDDEITREDEVVGTDAAFETDNEGSVGR